MELLLMSLSLCPDYIPSMIAIANLELLLLESGELSLSLSLSLSLFLSLSLYFSLYLSPLLANLELLSLESGEN
jgi:hypothetical protein